MSHYSLIRALRAIMTVVSYIYTDISASAIGVMIGKWYVLFKIAFFSPF